MALDGNFCHALSLELKQLIGGRTDKIFHSGSSCVEAVIYAAGKNRVLVLSALPSMPYAAITSEAGEHPSTPTTFCLLLRKHLQSSRITDVYALPHDRVLCFEFECADELGHLSPRRLYAELMGKYSNIILTDPNDRILGALHTADLTASKRQIMVGMPYQAPPPQDKRALPVSRDEFFELAGTVPEKSCERFILETFFGFSPVVCREICYTVCGRTDASVGEVDGEKLWFHFAAVMNRIHSGEFAPTAVFKEGKPVEFSYIPLRQYGVTALTKEYGSFSELLTDYYGSKRSAFLISDLAEGLFRVITQKQKHTEKKLASRLEDLRECEKKEQYRLWGDLLTSNIYRLKQGEKSADCIDYISGENVSVPMDTRLTPAKNAQRYYRLYTKYKNAEESLTGLIESDRQEITYLDSVFDCLARASTEQEISAIRSELESEGYIRAAGRKQKQKPLPPLSFRTTDGMTVLVGRNNLQNDALTKNAAKNDIWFHVKNAAGSHTILVTNGEEPSDRDYTEAAEIAASHSSVAAGQKVEVDYTRIRFVKKPPASKPGYVTYDKYYTAVVTAKK